MAAEEEINLILSRMKETLPVRFFKRVDETSAGISAVLRYLYETGGSTVTAGNISEFMHVSTARVAVLLKKMAAKGLIEKTSDKKDARVTVVLLSDHGREVVKKMQEDMCAQVGAVIDKVGLERTLEFIEILSEINTVASPPPVEF